MIFFLEIQALSNPGKQCLCSQARYNPIKNKYLLAICSKIYACPTTFSVASKLSCVKLRHRFIFVSF